MDDAPQTEHGTRLARLIAPVGRRVRLHAKLKALEEVPGVLQMTVEETFEVEGGDKPVCVAETLARVYEG